MIRRDPIYISYDVWRALWLLSKSKSDTTERAGGITMGKVVTADEIADDILRQAISEKHPQLFQHQKEIEKMDKKLIESLTK